MTPPDSAPSREPEKPWPEEPWAIDPLMIGTPWNIETADGRNSICLVSENEIGGKRNRAKHRTATAERIVSCVNAMSGVSDPAAMLEKVRGHLEHIVTFSAHRTWFCANSPEHNEKCPACLALAALALLPPIRISGDAHHAQAERKAFLP